MRLPGNNLHSTAIFHQRMQRRRITFDTRIPDDLALSTTPEELRQILCNLIANSLDTTAKGGRIAVRAAPAPGWSYPRWFR